MVQVKSFTLDLRKVYWVCNMKGKVKMFNAEKGYGFIRTEEGKDVFFHYTSLVMDSYKTAEAGEEVEFDVEESERGPRATNIHKL